MTTAGRPDRADDPARRPPFATPLAVALAVLVAMGAFTAARLASHDLDPTAFVRAGDAFTSAELAPDVLVEPDDLGYDGQFFRRLAIAPLSFAERDHGTVFDRPAYRHQRIAYPVMAWVLAGGGRTGLVPWALIAVNLGAVVTAAYVAARLAVEAGRPASTGFIVGLWPGLLVALAYDLSEPVAAAGMLATVLLIRRRAWPAATATATVAALARETTLLLPIGILVAAVARSAPTPVRRRLRSMGLVATGDGPPLLVAVVPMAVTGAWRLVIQGRWDDVPQRGPEIPSFLGIPFAALLAQVADWVGAAGPVDLYLLLQVILLVGVLLLLGRSLREPGAGLPHERLALIGALGVISMLPVWDRSVVFLRWADEAVIAGFAVYLASTATRTRPLVRMVGALWFTTALVWVSI